ncbi:hypothetical protein PF008_g28008 [Phytophthora fragariae]|uniref:Intimal thickness related receptor IRP domain-containing protein n=1 Tax=Phytophthora fragariae TaxID=53985 RepID=A0A6G0QCK4_9STRA|nr:hypothetical protein PF008_g28008 [Phytophthora fragariae]
MTITQDGMDAVSRSLFMPVMLMLDFGMFQYLVPVYYPRRHERRVQMLLLASFIGFATHVYFEHNVETMLAFNDISEACAQLTFLIQITLIGHAVRAKVKLRSITWFTYAAEALILLDWVNMLASAVEAAGVEVDDGLHVFSNVLESVTLTFVPVFRFYYLSLSSSFRQVLSERKLEMLCYFLVATHEDVFIVLEHATGVSWEYAQGIYMRSTIVTCILLNLRQKARPGVAPSRRIATQSSASSASASSGFNEVVPRPAARVVVTPVNKWRIESLSTSSAKLHRHIHAQSVLSMESTHHSGNHWAKSKRRAETSVQTMPLQTMQL